MESRRSRVQGLPGRLMAWSMLFGLELVAMMKILLFLLPPSFVPSVAPFFAPSLTPSMRERRQETICFCSALFERLLSFVPTTP